MANPKGWVKLLATMNGSDGQSVPQVQSWKRKVWRGIFWGLLALFLGLQGVPYGRVSTGGQSEPELNLPQPLREAVRRCCFDCHSDAGSVPWYGRVAPLSWWVSHEVDRARATMDFSAWEQYSPRQQALIWLRSLERIRRGAMPPPRYALAHSKFSPEEYQDLRDYVLGAPQWTLGTWTPAELLAWPRQAWSGESVAKVVFTEASVLQETLNLEGGALLVEGDLVLEKGLAGEGAVLVTGQLLVQGQNQTAGPVILVGLEGLSVSGSGEGQIHGALVSQGGRHLEGIVLQEEESLLLEVPGVRETLVDFCREDGEIGEPDERNILVRYAGKEFVLWEPEFQEVVRAASGREALEVVADLISRDPSTSLEVFRAKFRQDWATLLAGLPEESSRARLASHPLLLLSPLPDKED